MFLHGADYNPEQWLKYPEILKQDIQLMKEAGCNVMSIGIFSWAKLEPQEAVYTFEWLDQIINNLYENGIYTVLATPSGARPAWLSEKYPEVLRVSSNRVRNLHGVRHNHCYTSPLYREKVKNINSKLAERYANHPGVIMWHISNEYGGECHCELCQNAFREWLKQKYGTLENLNDSWWTTFWSHTYTSWEQIESPAPHGESQVHALNLDWKRFVTHQTIDFMKHEISVVKLYNPKLPATTNMMLYFDGLNYFEFKDEIDIISWDSYPQWHNADKSTAEVAMEIAAFHDIMRSLKKQPFMLMESTPSMTNWQRVSKLKKPGMHMLSSLQAIAHGSDTVQYFQWRKSRGSSEKLHGAVVDHYGKHDNRVFQDVKEVGKVLKELEEIQGATMSAEVAIIYDWENKWAIDDSQGPRNIGVKYHETIMNHYRPFWEKGINVDFLDMKSDISGYKLVIAPMIYMLRDGFSNQVRNFVAQGGRFVMTYWSSIVNETDLCFLGGFPGELMDVMGIRSEEIDGLFDGQINHIQFNEGNELGIEGSYECSELCDLIHAQTAEVLAVYQEDFYAGRPALTAHTYGQGKAYYIASRNEEAFQEVFFDGLIKDLEIESSVKGDLPKGVVASKRTKGDKSYIFIQNYTETDQQINISKNQYTYFMNDKKLENEVVVKPYEVVILVEKIN
ncbi:MAG: beta-galactosidase [Cellulosilyticaceae bacterium]